LRLTGALIIISTTVFAQLTVVPVPRISETHIQSRKSELTSQALPFWDDFSFNGNTGVPNDTLWESGARVFVNDGLGINPPSIKVATFDGLDSLGKPYNVTDVLAKGFADQLISRKINLEAVPVNERTSVFLSFYYQIKGLGEMPDTDDNFTLWFKNNNGTWENVFTASYSAELDPSVFNYVTVPLLDDRFFHAEFQFKFENFARLSGPYDMWHLDYVYLNSGRVAGERSMPDRTISMNLTSIFNGYHALPISHYRDTAEYVTVVPSIKLFGLLENNFQPFRYTTTADIMKLKDETLESKRILIEDDAAPVNPDNGNAEIILPFQILNLTLQKTFPNDSIDLSADSISIKMNFGLNTGDDNPLVYLPKYQPINFLRNDSSSRTFTLSSYYAKDDGIAEFGAGLNQAGAELAVAFDLFKSQPDTLAALDIYFPQFGDQNNRTLILKVWNHADSIPGSTLTEQTITVSRTAGNIFHRYQLSEPALITGKFYVGWKQTSAIMVPTGLDKNSDSGKSIFFNITGSWEQDSTFQGSLMVRPVFGKGNGSSITTGLPKKTETRIWPNPASDRFSIGSNAQIIEILDISGRQVSFQILQTDNSQTIVLQSAKPGIYILRWIEENKLCTARIMAGMH
jgi:hypothetical protein